MDDLQQAIESLLAETALLDVVRGWRDSGVSQGEAEQRLTKFMLELRASGREDEEDLIMDVLDCVVGWCAPGHALYEAKIAKNT